MGEYISSIKECSMFSVYGLIAGDEEGHFGECVGDGKYSIIIVRFGSFTIKFMATDSKGRVYL